MADQTLSFLMLLLLFPLAMLALGEIRNARGVFVAFMLAGAVLPFVLSLFFGLESPISVMPLNSREGIKAAILCIFALNITIFVSISTELSLSRRAVSTVFAPNARLANLYSLISLTASVLYVALMARQLGGIAAMVVRLYQRVSLDDSVANYLFILYYASPVFAVFSFIFSRKCGSVPAQLLSYFTVVICIAQTLMLGGRSLVVLLGVALFYVQLTRVPLRRFAVYSTMGAVLIAVTSYAMTNARFEAQNAAVLSTRRDESFLSRATTGLTFIDHVAISIRYVNEHGHDYGQLYANTLLLPVPRDLWPEKPLQISVQMRDFIFGDTRGGEPPGLFGEAYISFGSIGVGVAAAILGLLIGWINLATAISRRTGCRAREAYSGILAPLIAYAVVRGGMDVALMRVGIPAFWCFVAVRLATSYQAQDRRAFAARLRRSARMKASAAR